MRSKTQFFNGQRFHEYALARKELVKNEIVAASPEYLLSVDSKEYADYLINKYSLEFPTVEFDKVTVSYREANVEVAAAQGYPYMHEWETRTTRRQIISYHHPYVGELHLLSLAPTSRILTEVDVEVDQRKQSIDIEVINHRNSPEAVKQAYEQELQGLKGNYKNLEANVLAFNASLLADIPAQIEQRRQQLDEQQRLLPSLDVPLRANNNVPATFSIPKPKLRQKITIEPAPLSSYTPEPALDAESYHRILQLINDIGQSFERLPSIYKGKQEEDVRDFILLVVDPNLKWAVLLAKPSIRRGEPIFFWPVHASC